MRRAAICNLDLSEIDFEQKSVTVHEKGGQSHRYKISREGTKTIQDYLRDERGIDQEMFPHFPALFLPAETVVNSSGRLTPRVINSVWNEACRWANVKGKTPHAAPPGWQCQSRRLSRRASRKRQRGGRRNCHGHLEIPIALAVMVEPLRYTNECRRSQLVDTCWSAWLAVG